MHEVKNLKVLGAKINALIIKNPKTKIITIDGWTNSGKTKLITTYLAELTGWKVIHGDDEFLLTGAGKYIFNENKIKNRLKEYNKIIIDSVLVRKIFEIIEIIPNISVYVKRVRDDGYWIDKPVVDENSVLEKLLNYYNQPLEHQLILYHRQYKPHLNADIIYMNHDPFNDIGTIIPPEMFYQ